MPRFVLTPKEKRVLIFVVVCFLLGLATQSYRAAHPAPPVAADKDHFSHSDPARRPR